MYYFRVIPRDFADPASLVPRSIIAATMEAQNDCIALGPPSDNVTFRITFFDSLGEVFGHGRVISRASMILTFTQAGKTEEEAEALWTAMLLGLLRGDDATKYATAVALAESFGFALLPLEQQTGLLFDPEPESEQPEPENPEQPENPENNG